MMPFAHDLRLDAELNRTTHDGDNENDSESEKVNKTLKPYIVARESGRGKGTVSHFKQSEH